MHGYSSSWISSFRPRYNGKLLQAWPVAPSYSAEQIIDNPATRQHHRRELFIRCFEQGDSGTRSAMKYERNYRLRLRSSPEGRILFRRESRRFKRFYSPSLANHLELLYVFVSAFYFSDYYIFPFFLVSLSFSGGSCISLIIHVIVASNSSADKLYSLG